MNSSLRSLLELGLQLSDSRGLGWGLGMGTAKFPGEADAEPTCKEKRGNRLIAANPDRSVQPCTHSEQAGEGPPGPWTSLPRAPAHRFPWGTKTSSDPGVVAPVTPQGIEAAVSGPQGCVCVRGWLPTLAFLAKTWKPQQADTLSQDLSQTSPHYCIAEISC